MDICLLAEEYISIAERSQLYTKDITHLLAVLDALGIDKPKDMEYETIGDLIVSHVIRKCPGECMELF